jgi:hypothetical protein
MPRHSRHLADTTTYQTEPQQPPYRAAEIEPQDDDAALEGEIEPLFDTAEIFDYEPLDMAMASGRHGPFNGSPVIIADDVSSPGVLAMWYITRKRIDFSWKPWQMWVDPITRTALEIKPKYWRASPRLGAFW